MQSRPTATDNAVRERAWHFEFTPLPGGRNGYHLRLVPPRGENSACVIDFATLLAVLDYTDDEFVSVSQKTGDGRFRTLAVESPADAVELVEALPNQQDVYFGINPTSGPARLGGRRGGKDAVTRLAVLPTDLDVSPGKCTDSATAHAIIDDLSDILGTRPSAVTDSGGGLHAYWTIAGGHIDGQTTVTAQARAMLKRWARLVKTVAAANGAKADPVFDLARVLRVPGTANSKYATNGHGPTVAVCYADTGDALTLAEADAVMIAYGIPTEGTDAGEAEQIGSPNDWQFSDETCEYTRRMIEGWANPKDIELGEARHKWLLCQAVRLNCAWMLGCITETDYEHGKTVIAKAFEVACATCEPVRSVPPGEIPAAWQYGIDTAATKTVAEARGELGGHKHLWPAPDNPRGCAKRVVAEAKGNRMPLCHWSGTWFQWCGTHYRKMSAESFRDILYDLLCDAEYLGSNLTPLRWKPNTKKLSEVIDAARGLVKLPEGIGASQWIDGHGEQVIACANGLVRVAGRELLPHTPEFFNTFALQFGYEPDAPKPERWLKFLQEVFPNDPDSTETLQEWFGYILSGRTDLQKMLVMVGPPRSGKGTIVRTLIALIGLESHAAVTDTALANDFGLAPLIDKTLAVFADTRIAIKGKKLVETLLSVTGEDTVPVNRKYRDVMSVRMAVRFMIMSNELPVLPDNSGAIVSRMIALSTPNSWLGREDPGLADALREELPAILNWALDGMDRLVKRGQLKQPISGQAIIDLMSESASPIKQFVDETCVLGPHDAYFVSKAVLYDRYRSWCADHGHLAHSDVHLARALYAAYGNRVQSTRRGGRGERRMCFSGIALRPSVLGRGEQ